MDKSQWESQARAVIEAFAITGTPFTANHVWNAGLPHPENSRWLGPVMQRAKRDGLIRATARGIISDNGHGSPTLTVWVGTR